LYLPDEGQLLAEVVFAHAVELNECPAWEPGCRELVGGLVAVFDAADLFRM
jgi:hypothetical protein